MCLSVVGVVAQSTNSTIAKSLIEQKQKEPVGLPAGVSGDWYQQATEQLRQLEYSIRPFTQSQVFAAANSRQQLGFHFTPKGYSVKNILKDEQASWQVDFTLTGIGKQHATKEVNALHAIRNEQGTLEYDYTNYTVQYLNDEQGMRQNFIIKNQLPGTGNLEVAIQVSGMEATLENNSRLIMHDGKNAKLAYDEIKVWDANNTVLPAHMELRAGNELVIIVNDEHAVYPIVIDPLNHTPNWTDSGSGLVFPLLNDLSLPLLYGFSVSGAGDLNGDTFSDVVIGAPAYVDIINVSGGTFNAVSVGAAFVYYGSASGLSATPNEVLQPTSIVGALFGFSVSAAGDVNGDGRADLVVGAPGDHINLTVGLTNVSVAVGKVYIYHGTQFDGNLNTEPTVSATVSINTADFGILAVVPANPLYGFSVSNAGDVNNDGKSDILVGSPTFLSLIPLNLGGRVDIYHGSNSGIGTTPSKTILGGLLNGLFGYSVSSAGKVNNDSFDDIIVGSPGSINLLSVGAAFIFHGSATGIQASSTSGANASLNAPGLLNKTLFGYSVSAAGDVNADGHGDVIIGEPLAIDLFSGSLVAVGKAHIYYGSNSGITMSGRTELTSPRKPGLIGSILGNLLFGFSVSGAKDMNCDGIDDVIIGEPGGTSISLGSGLLGLVSINAVSGQAYLYYGRSSSGPVNNPGFTFYETGTISAANLLGYSVKGAGDVNGDGRADVVVGAPNGTLNLASSLLGVVGNVLGYVTTNSVGNSYGFHGCFNLPPVASNDNLITDEDVALSFNIISNDSDPDGFINPTTIDLNLALAGRQSTITTAEGSWSVNAAGNVTFTPLLNFHGTASITYVVADNVGLFSNTATIIITVNSVNDPPVAAHNNATTAEEVATTVNVVTNDTDVDGTIDITSVDLDPGTAGVQTTFVNTAGSWSVNASGVVMFTPAANFNGDASITYTVKDNLGAVSNIAIITITVTAVNDPPVAVNDSPTTNEDTPITFSVVINDTDIDGTIDPATVDLDPATAGVQHTFTDTAGAWIVDTDGNVTYTPAANFNGTATITYTVKDNSGLASSPGTISVTVTPVNDAPNAVNDNISTNEDTPVTFSVVANDTDVDGTIDPSTVDLDPSTAGIQNTITNASGTWTVNASGQVTFTPTHNFTNAASITYTVNDNSGATSDVATIAVTITPVNDPPVATNNTAATNEDVQVTFNVTGNDSDVDGTINAASVDLDPDTGGIQNNFNLHGTWAVNASGNVTYTPALNFNGSVSIAYTVNDNNGATSNVATITVTVAPVNDAPVAVNDSPSTGQNNPVTFNVTANDTDSDGTINPTTVDLQPGVAGIQNTATTAQGTWSVNSSGNVTFTPALNFTGTAALTYTVEDDGGATSNQGTISVGVFAVPPANQPPVAVNDSFSTDQGIAITFNITANDTDADGTIDAATVDLDLGTAGVQNTLTEPSGIWSVNNSGYLTFTPTPSFFGPASLTYEVKDNKGAVSNAATISIAVNASPVAVNDTFTINEDVTSMFPVILNDSDPDGTINDATVDLDPSTTGIQQILATPQGNWSANTTGQVTFVPSVNFNGNTSITYQVTDNQGALSNIATIAVTITPVNDVPVAVNDNISINEDASVTFSIVANDTDADGTINAATVDLDPGTAGIQNTASTPAGNWSVNAAGEVTFTPNANFSGAASITYVVNDNSGATSNEATISVIVVEVNDIPVAVNDIATIDEGGVAIFVITLNDTDADGTINSATVDLNLITAGIQSTLTTAEGSWSVNSQGEVTFTPITNFFGLATILYTVEDNDGAVSNVAAIEITINHVNQPPVAVDDLRSTLANTAITFNLVINDIDIDGNLDAGTVHVNPTTTVGILTFIITSSGTWLITPAGDVTFTPAHNFSGTATATYIISDTEGSRSNEAIIEVNVSAPVIPVTPVTGLAQSASTPELLPDGGYQVVLTFTAKNLSGEDVNHIQITNNLAATFPAPVVYSVISGTATGSLAYNTAFNGNSNQNLLTSGSTLADGASAQVSLTIVIYANGHPGTFANSATVTTQSDDMSVTYNDRSDDGSNPDSNNNGNPADADENDPTLILIPESPAISLTRELDLEPTLKNDCTYDVMLRIVVENTGNMYFASLAAFHDLSTGIAAPATFRLVGIRSDDLIVNPLYNGKDNTNMLAAGNQLGVGESAEIELIINIDPNDLYGPFGGTTEIEATDLRGQVYSHTSELEPFTLTPREIFIPQGFSPNGDGMHDYFELTLACGVTAKLTIFNRWGERVYQNNNYQNEWNGFSNHGNFMGKLLPEGTYYYTIELSNGSKTTSFLTLKF